MTTRDLIDFTNMQTIFNSTNEQFEALGQTRTVNGRKHVFIDNGADILAIAHLDSVNEFDHFYPVTIDEKDIVLSSRCDDRLGVYILIDLLPRLGLKYDILLTDFEEVGKSTAKEFISGRQYNWMFQFDRRLDDVVTYQYKNPAWLKSLGEVFKVGHGSASDISKLEHLNCSGVNVGAGYNNEHDHLAFFFIDMMCEQVDKFVKFYDLNKDIPYDNTKPEPIPINTYKSSYYWEPAPAAKPKKVQPTTYWCDSCLRSFKFLELEKVSVGGGFVEDWCEECRQSQGMVKCDACLLYTDVTIAIPLGETIELWCKDCADVEQEEKLDAAEYCIPPLDCKFCEVSLSISPSQFFIGICEDCENDAVQCEGCGRWIRNNQAACNSCIEKEANDDEPINIDTY